MILKYLGEKVFCIQYETRDSSRGFLENIGSNDEGRESENIDFYHFKRAYDYIQKFFKSKDGLKENFQKTLLEDCKVLWYEIEDDNEAEVFIRLNTGKIPLSVEENIKALFLARRGDDEDDLEEMAETWYKAETEARKGSDSI